MYLNGSDVTARCVSADDREGYVVCYSRLPAGGYYCKPGSNRLQTEVLCGDVQIVVNGQSIMCPACGRAVSLITRDRNGPRQDEAFEPAPYYLTTDGTHDIENAQIHGRQYPDVFVARCRVMNQRDPYPPFEGTDVMDGDENRS